MLRMTRAKIVAVAVVVVLVLFLLLQNLKPVDLTILWFARIAIRMPLAIMLVLMVGLGFVAGLLMAGRMMRGKDKNDERREKN